MKEPQMYAHKEQPRKLSVFGIPSRAQYQERERYYEDRVVMQRAMQRAMQCKSASKFLQDQENT